MLYSMMKMLHAQDNLDVGVVVVFSWFDSHLLVGLGTSYVKK